MVFVPFLGPEFFSFRDTVTAVYMSSAQREREREREKEREREREREKREREPDFDRMPLRIHSFPGLRVPSCK